MKAMLLAVVTLTCLTGCGPGMIFESEEAHVGNTCATSDWTGFKDNMSKPSAEQVLFVYRFNLDSQMACWSECTRQFGSYSTKSEACTKAVNAVYDAHASEAAALIEARDQADLEASKKEAAVNQARLAPALTTAQTCVTAIPSKKFFAPVGQYEASSACEDVCAKAWGSLYDEDSMGRACRMEVSYLIQRRLAQKFLPGGPPTSAP